MKRWVLRGVRTVVVLGGVILLTSFTIDATETFNDSDTLLARLIDKPNSSACADGTQLVTVSERQICVDLYENSYIEHCPHVLVASAVDTQTNLNEASCTTVSEPDRPPVTYLSVHQAKTYCARRGARLPTAREWYEAALGTPTDERICNTNGNVSQTGKYLDCRSSRGMYDMVGNVWEWVDEEVVNTNFKNRPLPSSGYVSQVDLSGMVTETSLSGTAEFGFDYAWTNVEGVSGVIRGGYHQSGGDAGIFAQNLSVPLDFKTAGVGFRCVRDI